MRPGLARTTHAWQQGHTQKQCGNIKDLDKEKR